MNRSSQPSYALHYQAADVLLVALSSMVTQSLMPMVHFLARFPIGETPGIWITPGYVPGSPLGIEHYFYMIAVTVACSTFLLKAQGYYSHVTQKSMWRSMLQIGAAMLWMALIIGLAAVFLNAKAPPKLFLAMHAFFSGVLLLLREFLVLRYLRKRPTTN